MDYMVEEVELKYIKKCGTCKFSFPRLIYEESIDF